MMSERYQREDFSDIPRGIETSAAKVGYKSPPAHSRFKPGQSGNPSGRTKGSQNFRTLFNKILNEKVSLREGPEVKKISKAEAVLRSVVVGALRGDLRNMAMLLRLAEQTGGFEQKADADKVTRIILTCASSEGDTNAQ